MAMAPMSDSHRGLRHSQAKRARVAVHHDSHLMCRYPTRMTGEAEARCACEYRDLKRSESGGCGRHGTQVGEAALNRGFERSRAVMLLNGIEQLA